MGETDTLIHITICTSSEPGEEIVALRVRSLGNPALRDSITTHTRAGSGVEEPVRAGRQSRSWLSVAPNPVRHQTTISYEIPHVPGKDLRLPSSGLSLYDRLGRRWLTVAASGSEPGRHELHWLRPSRLPSGIYLLRLNWGAQSAWQKVVVEE